MTLPQLKHLIENILQQNQEFNYKINLLLEENQALSNENNELLTKNKELDQKTSNLEEKVDMLVKKVENSVSELSKTNQKVDDLSESFKKGFQDNSQLEAKIHNVEEIIKDVESKTSCDNSLSTSSTTEEVEKQLKFIKHQEYEFTEISENKKASNKLFIRVNTYVNAKHGLSEIARVLHQWTNKELANEFVSSVKKVKPLKVSKKMSLFHVVLKHGNVTSFKALMRKHRSLLISSPVMIRSDLTYVTRLKRSILGLICERLRTQKGDKSACQKRINEKATLHFLDLGQFEPKKAIEYSYQEAIKLFGHLITPEEATMAYSKLGEHMPQFQKEAILLL